MIRYQADADLDHEIVLAVRRREPAIEFASAAEGGIIGISDEGVLEIAAHSGRILVSHDRRTMPSHFRQRLAAGKLSPGLFLVSQFEPVGRIVEVLVMVWAASQPDEWRDQVRHLPALSAHRYRL